jgi:predicted aspartyl protease
MGQSQSFYRLLLLSSFVGLACCACMAPFNRETTSQETTSQETTSTQNPESPSSELSPALPPALSKGVTPTESIATDKAPVLPALPTAYRDGINLASSAYALSQSAVSPDDWSLIASRWQQASDQLKQVGAKDKSYKTAQQKIAEYARNADHATAQLQALQQAVNEPMSPGRLALTRTSSPIEAATDSSKGAQRTSTQQIRVPIVRRLHGTPVVQVLFNGDRSYEMILDTGASRTLITRQMADELGVVATEKMIAATASETEVTFDIGQMRSVSLGEVTLQNARVSIGDSITVGLLGNDFLQGYDVTIRQEAVELTASKASSE